VIAFSIWLAKPVTIFKLMVPCALPVFVVLLEFEQATLLWNQPTSERLIEIDGDDIDGKQFDNDKVNGH
jgi:hypothetical protein